MVEMIKIPDEDPDKFLEMPEGLSGYWWETSSLVCIPFVASRKEGSGVFSKWLSEQEAKGKTVFFPTVISARLAKILLKRGYEGAYTVDKLMGYVDGLAKKGGTKHGNQGTELI